MGDLEFIYFKDVPSFISNPELEFEKFKSRLEKSLKNIEEIYSTTCLSTTQEYDRVLKEKSELEAKVKLTREEVDEKQKEVAKLEAKEAELQESVRLEQEERTKKSETLSQQEIDEFRAKVIRAEKFKEERNATMVKAHKGLLSLVKSYKDHLNCRLNISDDIVTVSMVSDKEDESHWVSLASSDLKTWTVEDASVGLDCLAECIEQLRLSGDIMHFLVQARKILLAT